MPEWFPTLNQYRGTLIDKQIAGAATDQEVALLEALNALADEHIEATALRAQINEMVRDFPGFVRAEYWALDAAFFLCSAVLANGKDPVIVTAPLMTTKQGRLLATALQMAVEWIEEQWQAGGAK